MNKKFSTLMASALLATSVGAFAQTGYTTVPGVFQSTDTEILEDKYYVLGVGSGASNVMAVNAQSDGSLVLKSVAVTDLQTLADVDSALWEVTTTMTGDGGGLRFSLRNKATFVTFAFDPENALKGMGATFNPTTSTAKQLGGVMEEWVWYSTRENSGRTFASPQIIQMGFRNEGKDSTLVIKEDASSNILYAVKDVQANATTANGAIQLQILKPGEWTLSAADLNTKGKDDLKYMELSFAEDLEGNLFAEKWQAQTMTNGTTASGDYVVARTKAAGTNSGYTNGHQEYVFLNKLNDKGDGLTYQYLRVDTGYYENTNAATYKKYNTLAVSKEAVYERDADDEVMTSNGYNVIDTIEANIPEDAFRFKFTKNLLNDSIMIESFSQFVELNTGRTPKNKRAGSNDVTYWTLLHDDDARVDGVTSSPAISSIAHADAQNNIVSPLYNVLSHAKLVDESKNVVTFYSEDVATSGNKSNLWAHFGTDDNLDSYADGLYKIRNVKTGEFLGVQIYDTDSVANFTVIDKDEMNLDHMPAFQWVVIKRDHSDARADKSPLAVTNREFANDNNFIWQLTKGTKDGETFLFDGVTEIEFIPVADDARKSATVGYKELSKEEVEVNRYTLNYLHPYTLDKFVAVHEDDSLMDVLGETATRFTIEASDTAHYGYKVAGSPAATYIPDLAQLARRTYDMYVGEKTVYINKENQLVMTDGLGDKPTTFYFKENNQIYREDKEKNVCYYALINIDGDHVKAGVVDNDLKALMRAQVMDETRTSVFAVEKDDAPLYRRFNNTYLNESATDGPDSLRFYENRRGEYLMDETNEKWQNEGMNYLGMWNAEKAEAGLAFRIDTAVINRYNGDVKPQYLISVSRNDMDTIPAQPCTLDHEHLNGIDSMSCPHAQPMVPGFERGKYLVSFADSVKDVPYTDIKNGYTRVGFLEAIRQADTLWILPEKFQALANEDIDFDELNAYNEALKDANQPEIKNILSGKHHKNYTWSFRYVNPEAGGNKVAEEGEANQFLIESNKYGSQPDIAPENAAWLKIQNGCIVLTSDEATFSNAKTGGDGALIFNVKNITDDEMATDNEEISTSEVTVIAGDGQITISGAAGKKVVVSNILGQVVANTVLTSDNATIASPQGVVVVAVVGEEAVKAIVK